MSEFLDKFIGGKKGAQACGVLLLACGIFLVISLVSHSAHDFPNSSRSPDELLNWGGYIGAYISYSTFMSIGYAAYILPILVLLWGWNRLKQQSILAAVYRSVGLSSMALLFSVGSGLPVYSSYTAFKLGGWLGTQVSGVILIPYGGRIGSAVLLGALFIMASIMTTDIDPRIALHGLRSGFRAIGRGVKWVFGLPARFISSMVKRKNEAKKERESDTKDKGETLTAIGSPSSVEGAEEAVQVLDTVVAPELVPDTILETPDKEPGEVPPPRRERPARPARARKSEVAQKAHKGNEKNGKKPSSGKYKIPSIGLLDEPPNAQGGVDKDTLLDNARLLEDALGNFDIGGKVVEVSPGPVVTRYEVEPAPGVKVNRIVTLADDLARVMSANGIRIQAPVPGKSVVGVEIANQQHETVYLSEILESKEFRKAESKLTIALGKTISGEPFVADLAKMPHLLVAGATGSGKSVCINSLISSILFKSTPDEVRLIMVDPKVVELTMYNDIPHLLVPVITDPKKASEALKWTTAEMEARYQKLAALGVRNLDDYNRKLGQMGQQDLEDGIEPEKPMPYIVAVIDEFADLMLTAPADVETSLMSLAQKSRAVGIHIVLATQRPSVNVITGVIKANFPSRIAFQVASKTDSRTILDFNGAERLLGRGDMLFLPGGQGEPIRIHGAFISGEETEKLVDEISSSNYQAEEVAVLEEHADIKSKQGSQDELFDEAMNLVTEYQQASTSFLQRRMKIGYSRAARLMDELESAGIVGPAEGAKPRQIMIAQEGGEELATAAEIESN